MTQEQYVSYEVAKLLHEKGFQINPNVDYWKIGPDGHMYFMSSIGAYTSDKNNKTAYYRPADSYPCPTQQMAMRWLREKHKLFIQIRIIPHTTITIEQKYYLFTIHKDRRMLDFRKDFPSEHYFTYEEACEAAIKYCLEHLI